MHKILVLGLFVFRSTAVFAQSYKEVPIQVLAPQSFVVNSVGGKLLGKNNNIVIPFQLPPNTVRWFYTFSASRNTRDIGSLSTGLKLLAQLTQLIDQTGTTKNVVNLLASPPGTDFCNVYHITKPDDATKFESEFGMPSLSYNAMASRSNFREGTIEVLTPDYQSGTQYLGFKNPAALYEVIVFLEVVAIVQQEVVDSMGYTSTDKFRIYNQCLNFIAEESTDDLEYKQKLANCIVEAIVRANRKEVLAGISSSEMEAIIVRACSSCKYLRNEE